MALSPIEFGALVDSWVEAGRVKVVETRDALTVSNLAAAEVEELNQAANADWRTEIVDGARQPSDVEHLDDQMGPYIVTIYKPTDAADLRLLTCAGLVQALATTATGGVRQLASAKLGFATFLVSFNPWGRGDVFAPAAPIKSPLELVRESAEARVVPADIRKWLLRSPVTDLLWLDPAFQTFARAASGPLIRSLASEVIGREAVVFTGPPRLNLPVNDTNLTDDLQQAGFTQVQSAVAWIYEDPVSAEQRHGLFAAEFARSVTRNESIGDAFRKAGKDILEGARLTYQLSQSELSREAIKAQGDLRRAIADDMAKAAEGTRTLATAIAVAIATGIGLIAARSTAKGNPGVLSWVTGIVAVYLIAVTFSGWQYLRVQKSLRQQWRRRFYRFIPSEDYTAMVTTPAAQAERPYHFMGVVALAIAAALIWLACTGLSVAPGGALPPSSKKAVGDHSLPAAKTPSAHSASKPPYSDQSHK